MSAHVCQEPDFEPQVGHVCPACREEAQAPEAPPCPGIEAWKDLPDGSRFTMFQHCDGCGTAPRLTAEVAALRAQLIRERELFEHETEVCEEINQRRDAAEKEVATLRAALADLLGDLDLRAEIRARLKGGEIVVDVSGSILDRARAAVTPEGAPRG